MRSRRLGGAMLKLAAVVMVLAATASGALAQADAREVRIGVVADSPEGEAALGLMEHLAPRFWLKTQIDVTVARVGEASELDLLLAPQAEAERLAGVKDAGRPTPVFRREGTVFAAVGLATPDDKPTQRFFDWLVGDVAARAIEGYEPPDGVAFSPDVAREAEAAPVVAEATPQQLIDGERIAYRQCGRCHVIGERNKYGGIGSTPSFPALRGKRGWRERFEAFWGERPRRAFSQVEGVTPPFDPRFPPPVTPIELTLDDIDAILAFIGTLEPKHLGAPLKID